MRYILLSLALSSAFMAALLALSPKADSQDRTNSGHANVTQAEQSSPAAIPNLPTATNFNSAPSLHCGDRLAQLLTALESKACS